MTLRLYARRKEWPLESVSVELSHERVHQEDCEGCEEPGHMIEVIRRYMVLKGPLTAEQQARLGEIATRCPVHKTLTTPPRIEDELDVAE